MRLVGVLAAMVTALALCGCATVYNLPLNEPSANPLAGIVTRAAAAERPDGPREALRGGDVVALSFSGGGTRAAAFSFGVLEQLARTPSPGGGRDLLDHIGVVSGVSGGAITASYFGLKGRAALADFRQQFLTQDLMAQLHTDVSLVNIGRALGGGANTDEALRQWLDARLYHGATFGDLIARGRPITLINATDIYSRTPFLFMPQTLVALCSDLDKYPVAAGVAASAAVPGAFAPVVVEAFPDRCSTPLPPEIERAANNPTGSPLVHSYAQSLVRARTGGIKFVKLLDGGLVDNYGLSGVTIALGLSGMPTGPLKPREAVDMRRLLFLVVDSGRGPSGDWSQTVEGPTGKELVSAVVDAIIDANTRSSYAAFEASMKNWREQLVRWRCSLKPGEVAKLRGHGGPWNCRDLKFIIGRVSFDQFDAERAKRLNAVPTSFTLPADTVDELRQAGADALKSNPAFQTFLREAR
jgi:predicted acylesterase/phospholipase RssA